MANKLIYIIIALLLANCSSKRYAINQFAPQEKFYKDFDEYKFAGIDSINIDALIFPCIGVKYDTGKVIVTYYYKPNAKRSKVFIRKGSYYFIKKSLKEDPPYLFDIDYYYYKKDTVLDYSYFSGDSAKLVNAHLSGYTILTKNRDVNYDFVGRRYYTPPSLKTFAPAIDSIKDMTVTNKTILNCRLVKNNFHDSFFNGYRQKSKDSLVLDNICNYPTYIYLGIGDE